MYMNDRSSSFVRDGVLYLKPYPTSDWMGENEMKTGSLDLGDECTDGSSYGCSRNVGDSGNYLNPITSAKLTTKESFSFKYGRVEVSAKLPQGDWIWPAIWLMPKDSVYGTWPTSGEIDLMESHGNDPSTCNQASNQFGSTMHFGPVAGGGNNAWPLANAHYTKPEGNLSDDFHLYELNWTPEVIETYIDGELVLSRTTDDMFATG